MQPSLLEASAVEINYNPEAFNAKIGASEAALFPLTVTARLAKRDFSWGRFGCEDLNVLQRKTRVLVVRFSQESKFEYIETITRSGAKEWLSSSRFWIRIENDL
jgi:hypothetical protein